MSGPQLPYTALHNKGPGHLDEDGFPDITQESVSYDDAMAPEDSEEESVAAQLLELLKLPAQVRNEELRPLLDRCESGRALLDLMVTCPRYVLADSDSDAEASTDQQQQQQQGSQDQQHPLVNPEDDGTQQGVVLQAPEAAVSGQDAGSSSGGASSSTSEPQSPLEVVQGDGGAGGGSQEEGPVVQPWVDALLAYGLLGPWDSGQMQQLRHILGITESTTENTPAGDCPAPAAVPGAPAAAPAAAPAGDGSVEFQALQQDVVRQLQALDEDQGALYCSERAVGWDFDAPPAEQPS
jgi:hypothetical protein